MSRRHRFLGAIAAAVLALGLLGCGDDDDSSADDGGADTTEDEGGSSGDAGEDSGDGSDGDDDRSGDDDSDGGGSGGDEGDGSGGDGSGDGGGSGDEAEEDYSNGSDEIPNTIPLPDDAEIGQAIGDPEGVYSVNLRSGLTVDEAASFYQDDLPRAGWSAVATRDMGGDVVLVEGDRSGGDRTIAVQITPTGDGTSIQISSGSPG